MDSKNGKNSRAASKSSLGASKAMSRQATRAVSSGGGGLSAVSSGADWWDFLDAEDAPAEFEGSPWGTQAHGHKTYLLALSTHQPYLILHTLFSVMC